MSEIDRIQNEIVQDFREMGDGFEQYAYLIELSVTLPPLPAEKKTEDRVVKGCQSHVWLDTWIDENGRFYFAGDSDTLILKGVLVLLRRVFCGQPAQEVAGAQLWFFGQTEIMATFDADRQKGIGFIIQSLQRLAAKMITQL
jgi:cysteine desulfuration protein SufE